MTSQEARARAQQLADHPFVRLFECMAIPLLMGIRGLAGQYGQRASDHAAGPLGVNGLEAVVKEDRESVAATRKTRSREAQGIIQRLALLEAIAAATQKQVDRLEAKIDRRAEIEQK